MNSPKKNPLDRVCIQPPSKPGQEIRSLLKGVPRDPSSAGAAGVQRQLDARLTRYDEGSDKTIAEIQDMLDRSPDNESLLDWLAFMMYTNERYIESIALYGRLIDINSSNPTAHYYTANCHFKMGDIDKAILQWRQTMILNPQGKIGRKAAARIEMAKGKLFGTR